MATLLDDGTMDTVVQCDTCGQVTRFNFDGSSDGDEGRDTPARIYDEFVDECLQDVDDNCMYCERHTPEFPV